MTTEGRLDVRMFGELALRQDGHLLALPPSKKTRALLGYLVLTERPHRREQLCRLFWDVTDDPRGALRWSLSKLRPLVDADGKTRLVADRESVQFVRGGAHVDVLSLREALRGRVLAEVATDKLDALSDSHQGELLEGLELPEFDDYQAWCLAEREEARRLRAGISSELVERFADAPEQALGHARRWLALDPLGEPARATLVRLLGQLGRRDEARQHYESGLRLEAELGRKPGSALREAFHALEAGPATPVSKPAPAASKSPVTHPTPFFGRTAERSLLDSLLARCRSEQRLGLLVITGEPGVGKTRLLESWSRPLSREGVRVLSAASYEAESGHPYAPWLDALRDLEGRAVRAAQELLEGAEDPARDAGHGRERLFGALAAALGELAQGARGLVLVLDDVQWMDESSCALLSHAARTHRHEALFIVLLGREGELADNAALARVLRGLRREGQLVEHGLAPLSVAETVALVSAVEQRADAPRIAAESAGNPLFALELARATAGREGVPATLRSLVRDRIAQLAPEAADLLRWAAVLGCGFSVERIVALTSLRTDALLDALDVLEGRALLRRERESEERYAFAHEVVRQVMYTDLSEPRRRLMHRRVAELLRAEPEPTAEHIADVARHAALAQDAALAAEACLSAARRSLRLFANADAHALARRGLRHAERLEEPVRTRLSLELMDVSFAARRPEPEAGVAEQVEALAERALDLGISEHARLGFHLLSYLSFERGAWADARKHSLQAELVSRGGSERERVLGLAEAARCLVLLERDLGHAQALALEAAARARNAQVEPSAIFDALGMLKLHQGQSDEARSELERARGLAHASRERYDEFQALEHLVLLELERGRHDVALAQAEELCLLGAKIREGSEAPFAHSVLALCKLALGHTHARADLERELAALVLADAKHRLLTVLTRAAWLGLAEQPAWAEDLARRALPIAELLGRPSERALAHVVLARCARRAGDVAVLGAQRDALSALPLTWVSAFVRGLAAQELDARAGTAEPPAGEQA